jgi:hypothetical protein
MRVEEDLEPKLGGNLEQLHKVVNVLLIVNATKKWWNTQ